MSLWALLNIVKHGYLRRIVGSQLYILYIPFRCCIRSWVLWDLRCIEKMLVVNGLSAALSSTFLFANSLWLPTIELHWHRAAMITQRKMAWFLTRVSNSQCFLPDELMRWTSCPLICLARSSDGSLGTTLDRQDGKYFLLYAHVSDTLKFPSKSPVEWILTL